MNEYQDQVLWWEVQVWTGRHWMYVSDHDSLEDAEDWKTQYEQSVPDRYRVKRMAGLRD